MLLGVFGHTVHLGRWDLTGCNMDVRFIQPSTSKKVPGKKCEQWKKRAPGWLGYIGDEILPSYFWDYFINHYCIRIPINQLTSRMVSRRVFSVAHVNFRRFSLKFRLNRNFIRPTKCSWKSPSWGPWPSMLRKLPRCTKSKFGQWIFQVPLKGGRDDITP